MRDRDPDAILDPAPDADCLADVGSYADAHPEPDRQLPGGHAAEFDRYADPAAADARRADATRPDGDALGDPSAAYTDA